MCNLFASTMPPDAMRHLFDADISALGNAAPRPAIFPRGDAPVIRPTDSGREAIDMHWGFLMPQVSKKTGKPILPKAVNNARDDKLRSSGFWRKSFEERRCLLPATSFCEAKGRNPATYVWFGVLEDDRPAPFAFAGLWRSFKGTYRDELVEIETCTMITSTPNALVKPVHPDRMPVILPRSSWDTWLAGTPDEAFELLVPYPADHMTILGEGVGMKSEPGVA